MKLELKNIKVFSSHSQETECFSATLYVDGKRFATIDNDGWGGPNRVDPVKGMTMAQMYDHIKEINAYLATTLEAAKNEVDAIARHGQIMRGIKFDLETWTANRVADHLYTKDLKTLMRSKVVYRGADGQLHQWAWKGVRKVEQRHIDSVRDRCDGPILNELPFAEALEIWKDS